MGLLSYVKGSLKKTLVAWFGDKLHEAQRHAYADADFAGRPRTLRSMPGAQMQIEEQIFVFCCMPGASGNKLLLI